MSNGVLRPVREGLIFQFPVRRLGGRARNRRGAIVEARDERVIKVSLCAAGSGIDLPFVFTGWRREDDCFQSCSSGSSSGVGFSRKVKNLNKPHLTPAACGRVGFDISPPRPANSKSTVGGDKRSSQAPDRVSEGLSRFRS